MRQRARVAGNYAAVDNLLGPDSRTEPLDEQEQEAVIREFEALSLQDHIKWRIVFGGGALLGGLFFLYAAFRQHVEPFGVVSREIHIRPPQRRLEAPVERHMVREP
jgi:hypothetical protein